MECWPAIPPITNHCRPLHAAAGVIYLLLHCTELHFALPWLRLSYINPATHLYVRAKHRCVCIPCPCLFHLLHMPPQSSSNVIAPCLSMSILTSVCVYLHPNVPLCRSAVSPALGFTALANIPAASYRACMLPISAAPPVAVVSACPPQRALAVPSQERPKVDRL